MESTPLTERSITSLVHFTETGWILVTGGNILENYRSQAVSSGAAGRTLNIDSISKMTVGAEQFPIFNVIGGTAYRA